ncbi:MAG: glycosyltransferase [Eubacterium sp.]|nr:glycosyltransferase [Eubacterium sp.]
MKNRISVIVPLFHGKRYVKNLLEAFRRNSENLHGWETELILVNDCPEEQIDPSAYKGLPLRIIRNAQNCGIHQSRVNGFSVSSGSYVTFWDQDDQWDDCFLKSQLEHIDQADVIFCDAIYRSGLRLFEEKEAREKILSRDWYIKNLMGIISPGQALIKRSAIPEAWTKFIMQTNYCDDAYLWVLMKDCGKIFSINDECLYRHMEDGTNTSSNWENNIQSLMELRDLTKRNRLLTDEHQTWLDECIRNRISTMLDCIEAENVLKDISSNSEHYKRRLNELQIHSLSIYGFGSIGAETVQTLDEADIQIVRIYDRSAKSDAYEIQPLVCDEQSDLILVTVVVGREQIISDVRTRTRAKVISLLDFERFCRET